MSERQQLADLTIGIVNRQIRDAIRRDEDLVQVGPKTLMTIIGEIYRLRAALAPAGAIGDDDLPVHFPITVTANGEGPAEPHEAVATTCWCADPDCTKFYGVNPCGNIMGTTRTDADTFRIASFPQVTEENVR